MTARHDRCRGVALVAALVAALAGNPGFAQAPASAQQPGRQLADTPPPLPGAGGWDLPAAEPALVASDIRIRPADFQVTGVTVFTPEELRSRLSEFRDRELDVQGLARAAASLRRLYLEAGYPLTDVCFPEQRFAAQGGTVEIAVVEARLGRVRVTLAPGVAVSAQRIRDLVQWHLRPGELVTQAGLDRPVLLLRDMPGISATADVSPGEATGQVDVTVQVRPQGTPTSFSLALDNHGMQDVGRWRLTFTGSVDNLLGGGDTLSVSLQPASRSGTVLYRLGYRATVAPAGTRALLTFSHSQYRLGGAFAGLNASGHGRMGTLAIIHPLVRGRRWNAAVHVGAEARRLRDEAAGMAPERAVDVGKLGLLGSFADAGLFAEAITRFSLAGIMGRSSILDAATLQADQAPTGPGTQGTFRKFNLELQRLERVTGTLTLTASAAAQWASRNLTSAEKLALTGPQAVRCEPAAADTVVDQGLVLTLEMHHRLAAVQPFGGTARVAVFHDRGLGWLHKVRSATTNSLFVGAANRVDVAAWGLAASVNREGNFAIEASVARGVSRQTASRGRDPVQFWLSAATSF